MSKCNLLGDCYYATKDSVTLNINNLLFRVLLTYKEIMQSKLFESD